MRARVSILAPIIMICIIGLVGVDTGHAAKSKVHSHKSAKTKIAKSSVHHENKASKKHAHVKSKKRPAKRKSHTRHAAADTRAHRKRVQYAELLQPHRGLSVPASTDAIEPAEDGYLSSSTQPSDLWLAKDLQTRSSSNSPEAPSDELTLKILESAQSYLGTRYRFGGTSPESGFDCSGFVQHVFGENGIQLGRSSRDQAREGIHVPLSALKPGDLIFFSMHNRKHSRIDHVGLYIGDGQFIHAASSRSRQIKVEDLKSVRYLSRVVTTRRVIDSVH